MERVIKFRAWDKKLYKMLPHEELSPQNNKLVYGRRATLDSILLHDDYEIMQFTGLTDKNGKDIHEGDIIKFQIFANWDEDKMSRHTAKVVFRQGCFMWEIVKEGRQSDFHYSRLHQPLRDTCSTWGLEVIGNIYENPELLSTDKTKTV